jgi:hypothetical protein
MLHLIGLNNDSWIQSERCLFDAAFGAGNAISRLRPVAQPEIGIARTAFPWLPSDRSAGSMVGLHCSERKNGRFPPLPPTEREVEPGIPAES